MLYFILIILWLCVAQLCRVSLGGSKLWYKSHILKRIVNIWFVPFIYLLMTITRDHLPKGE